jgi:hypothetical protein
MSEEKGRLLYEMPEGMTIAEAFKLAEKIRKEEDEKDKMV